MNLTQLTSPYAVRVPVNTFQNALIFVSFINRFLFPTLPEARIQISQEGVESVFKEIQEAYKYRTRLETINTARQLQGLSLLTEEQHKQLSSMTEAEIVVKESKPGRITCVVQMNHLFESNTGSYTNISPSDIHTQMLGIFYISAALKNNNFILLFSTQHVEESLFEAGSLGVSPRPVANFNYRVNQKDKRSLTKLREDVYAHLESDASILMTWIMGLADESSLMTPPFNEINELITEASTHSMRWSGMTDVPSVFRYYAQLTPWEALPSSESPGRLVCRWAWNHVLEISYGRTFLIPLRTIYI